MKSITTLLTAAALAALVHQPAPAGAADIVFTGGSADLTFYYDSVANTWATVLRSKGDTVATGLTAPFDSNSTPATWNGIVGLGTDFTFTSLNPVFNTTSQLQVGAINYYVSAANASPFTSGADFGIRTRLRENFGSGDVNQFANFNLTLNLAASTFDGNPLAGNANVSLVEWDALTEAWTVFLDTATSQNTATLGNYEHKHRNWGFSEYGNYSLVFDLQGVGGLYGDTASIGSTTVNFDVVPEPSTYALLATALGLGALLRRRLRK